MITGFNTDVEFQGITYHVQTEDKGLATPLILSLVYDRGTILASKRSPYDDLLAKGFDEKVLADRLQKQHKLICAAIRAGRIEELKQMTLKDSAAKEKAPVARKEIKENELKKNAVPAPQVLKEKPLQAEKPQIKLPVDLTKPIAEKKAPAAVTQPKPPPAVPKPPPAVPKPKASQPFLKRPEQPVLKPPAEPVYVEPIVEAVKIIEDEVILPAEAVEIILDADEVQAPADNKLKLEIVGDDKFRSGEKKTISILTYRGDKRNGLGGAQIMIKVIGSAFRPQIFHAKTDNTGVANVHLQMPQFKSGRAVILIKAMSNGDEAELRKVIRQR